MEMTECNKEKLLEEYRSMDSETRKILECSFGTVAEIGTDKDRLQDIREFSKQMGYKRIGIAHCKALTEFAVRMEKELVKDFEVYRAGCKLCKISKDELNVAKINPDDSEEIACNPVGQALALNEKDVDLAVKCGFCVGHDIVFSRYNKSPSTTILTKDRKHKHKSIEIFGDI